MTTSQTYELTLFPGGERARVLTLLEKLNITGFVESAGDVNVDDSDWEAAFADWSTNSSAPIIVYSQTQNELSPLLKKLQDEMPNLRFEEKFIADTLWQEAWEPGFEALETEEFYIAAENVFYSGSKKRITLTEAPVFGSGQHATTQALVRLLERQPKQGPRSFLDVGTGTGVLCFVAAHLGFARITGTDIEDNAIENCQDNSRLNEGQFAWILGSLPSLFQKWDVIVCNILPPTLTDLLDELKARLNQGGELYLAGFHEANKESVRTRIDSLGLEVSDECAVRNWLAWKVV